MPLTPNAYRLTPIASFCEGDEFVAVAEFQRHWLFKQQMPTGEKRVLRDRVMQVRGKYDIDGVELFAVEHFTMVRVDSRLWVVDGSLRAAGIGMSGNRDELRGRHGSNGSRVVAAPGTVTDQAETYSGHAVNRMR